MQLRKELAPLESPAIGRSRSLKAKSRRSLVCEALRTTQRPMSTGISKEEPMTNSVTHNIAPTQFVEGDGLRYAYRTLGPTTGTPLVFCHRFRGTMDDWDPAVIDGIAAERPVILFDSAGIGLSTGETPDSVKGMADKAAEFIRLLRLTQVDLLGFSIGGFVALTVALDYPELVRRLVLAGTGPGGRFPADRGGEGIVLSGREILEVACRPVLGLEEFLFLFFSPSEESRSAARRYWERVNSRPDREPAVSEVTIKAQVAAMIAWSRGNGSAFPRLGEIKQPVLVVNGSNDVMVPTMNSYTMAQKIKDATLIVYPDSGHGFLFQYPETFRRHVLSFLK
jgi:pimeloyl-ACP methyl ester carboxylesterase